MLESSASGGMGPKPQRAVSKRQRVVDSLWQLICGGESVAPGNLDPAALGLEPRFEALSQLVQGPVARDVTRNELKRLELPLETHSGVHLMFVTRDLATSLCPDGFKDPRELAALSKQFKSASDEDGMQVGWPSLACSAGLRTWLMLTG